VRENERICSRSFGDSVLHALETLSRRADTGREDSARLKRHLAMWQWIVTKLQYQIDLLHTKRLYDIGLLTYLLTYSMEQSPS
jgi:hypothetical protein